MAQSLLKVFTSVSHRTARQYTRTLVDRVFALNPIH